MNSIEFGKKCRPYNVQYRDIFGYVPCRNDYECSQDEYFNALLNAIESKKELASFVPRKAFIYLDKRMYILKFFLQDDYYVTRSDGVLFKIEKSKYNVETTTYAYNLIKLYNLEKDEIVRTVLPKLNQFYETKYALEEAKEKLGIPYITVMNNRFGVITWFNHQFDEHIIECEFVDDMRLLGVTFDG